MPTKIWGRADCIVGFSFGAGKDDPGPVNRQLANNILTCFTQYGSLQGFLPQILQWEIADSIQWERGPIKVVREHGVEKGKYLDTFEVAVQARLAMSRNRWQRCIIAAHEDHVRRCQLTMEKLGAEVVGVITTALYDQDSTQKWTKSRLRFLVYDRCVAMPYYRLKRYI